MDGNQKKIHDVETLITEAVRFDAEFQEYLDFGRRLTAYYYEERYPPGLPPNYSKKEVENAMNKTEDLITKIKEEIERNLE
ncbi:MAG: HEPN domain-containing protein [Candidatus Methanofastidiosia archaeon]